MAVSLISFSVPVFKLWGTQLPHCFLRLAQGERLKTINKNQTTVPKSKRFCQHNTEEHPSVRERALCWLRFLPQYLVTCWVLQMHMGKQVPSSGVPSSTRPAFTTGLPEDARKASSSDDAPQMHRDASKCSYSYLHSPLLKLLRLIMLHQHLFNHSG